MAEKKGKVAPVQLFDKYGEFGSVEELNQAAAGLREEGDIEGLKELARENGIDPYEVEDYVEGETEELATLPPLPVLEEYDHEDVDGSVAHGHIMRRFMRKE